MTDDIKKTEEPHPCQYCSTPCFGKQCRGCHMKMIESRNGNCAECNKVFKAERFDGSRRLRCMDCHVSYSEKHFAPCPDCNKTYRWLHDNGTVYNRCSTCYNESKNKAKCVVCNEGLFSTRFDKCSTCYKKSIDEKNVNTCSTNGCENKCEKTFCRDCFNSRRTVSDQYMVSRCNVCDSRVMGDYKTCRSCLA